ncbi:hypothetical protein KKC63_02255 [Patescibacteria group bacterium]|nr:hypothetical protein [Patescibacteria group bacterium]MBU4023102.1 hypothetical protein [Patescibacteria group bacterium]MBU4078346.1 hypothetical protein [Patescibacteria group bacterium]
MINLLSLKEKKERKQEQDLKVIFIIGVFILSALIVAGLSFLSIDFYLANQVEYQKALTESRISETNRIKLLDEKISKIDNILFEFNDFYNEQFTISTFLYELSDLLLPGISLDFFSYNEKGNKIMITGTASDVEEADEFRNALREQEGLNNIIFTLPDWLQTGKINFRVEFELEK